MQVETLACNGASDGSQALPPASLAVSASARLTLPAHSAGQLPEISHAAYTAASILRQHITSLQPRDSEALADSSVIGQCSYGEMYKAQSPYKAVALTCNVTVAADPGLCASLRDQTNKAVSLLLCHCRGRN